MLEISKMPAIRFFGAVRLPKSVAAAMIWAFRLICVLSVALANPFVVVNAAKLMPVTRFAVMFATEFAGLTANMTLVVKLAALITLLMALFVANMTPIIKFATMLLTFAEILPLSDTAVDKLVTPKEATLVALDANSIAVVSPADAFAIAFALANVLIDVDKAATVVLAEATSEPTNKTFVVIVAIEMEATESDPVNPTPVLMVDTRMFT